MAGGRWAVGGGRRREAPFAPPSTAHRDDQSSRAQAARIMRDSGCDALVVFAGERVVGVLTAVDLVRSLAQEGHGNDH